jgi:O-methyltransferase involved in polyketide biosynthesis
MPPNPAAQTAFGPMVLVAVEQSEPPDRRLFADDLAVQFLPTSIRWLVNFGRHLTASPIEWTAYAEKA